MALTHEKIRYETQLINGQALFCITSFPLDYVFRGRRFVRKLSGIHHGKRSNIVCLRNWVREPLIARAEASRPFRPGKVGLSTHAMRLNCTHERWEEVMYAERYAETHFGGSVSVFRGVTTERFQRFKGLYMPWGGLRCALSIVGSKCSIDVDRGLATRPDVFQEVPQANPLWITSSAMTARRFTRWVVPPAWMQWQLSNAIRPVLLSRSTSP